jgi:hypothetical protein
MEQPKRFSEWEEVKCSDCEHYYTNACDGVKIAQKRICNQFLATRGIVIPAQINMLKKRFKMLIWAYLSLAVGLVLHIIFG